MIALIICILILFGIIFYHIKYKKPFLKYEDDFYNNMLDLRFYIMLIVAIIFLTLLEFKK